MSIKIYTDKQKLIQYLEKKGISKNKFYKETGLSNGFLDSGSSFSLENLRLIIDKYRDINIGWLITGKGEMLISDQKEEVESKEPVSEQDKGEMWDRLRQSYEDIGMLKAKNHQLTDEIALLKKELYTVRNTLDVTSVKLDSLKMQLAQHEGVKK